MAVGGVSLTLHDSIRGTCRLTSCFSPSSDRLGAATLPAPEGPAPAALRARGYRGTGTAGLQPWLGGQEGIVGADRKYFVRVGSFGGLCLFFA